MRKLVSGILSAAMVASLMAVPAVAEETADSTYHVLYSGENSTLNYLVTSTQAEQVCGANTIDTLVEYDNKGNVQAGLATEWGVSEDGLTWTFTLREGVKWVDHTGAEVAEVTANDFVAAMKYQLTPEYESANVQNFFGKIKNAEEYFKGLAGEEGYEEIAFEEVGIKAVDDYTLEYTLEAPCPYFLSTLVYVNNMPAYGPQLEELGESFGTDNEKMYYCGAYYMAEFEPQVKHVYKKNTLNWDADQVYIETIEKTYNTEAGTIGPEMIKRGEVDEASIGADILDAWMADPETSELISKERSDTSYSYFYCMNFNPNFEEEYAPANWKLAVNNENFRKAVQFAVNSIATISISEPNAPQQYQSKTITPVTFATLDGVDYTQNEAFTSLEYQGFDMDKAVSYKEAAMEELTAEGATFPVTVLVKYNPSSNDWDKECVVLEQQVEYVLGTDFIDIVVEAGPSENFLSEVRRSGEYALMKCNWGADYADPETWTDPVYQAEGDDLGYKYQFMRTAINEGTAAAADVQTYFDLVEEAKSYTIDLEARYDAFAKAEAFLIDKAFVIPYGISVSSYLCTKLDVFEGQNAAFGISRLRYKGMSIKDHYISMTEFEENANK